MNKKKNLYSFYPPPSLDLKFSYSVCLSWQRLVSMCVLLLLSCPAETKSKRARKQRLGCWAQNLLSKHFEDHIFTLWVTIRFPSHCSFVQPSQDLLAYCYRQFLGGRDQRQARVINPHHWGLRISASRGMAVFCHVWVVTMEVYYWMWVEWFCTHSSDNRCSRWKALGWILLMLFILRSLEREKRGKHQY